MASVTDVDVAGTLIAEGWAVAMAGVHGIATCQRPVAERRQPRPSSPRPPGPFRRKSSVREALPQIRVDRDARIIVGTPD